MKEKKKEKRSSLRAAILLLLLIAILLISSTYAWFTANRTVTISTIDVNVAAQNGLQISTDGATWKTVIQNTDITANAYSGNVNQLPAVIEPVSTIGEIDSSTGYMKMYYGTVEANAAGVNQLTAVRSTEEAGATGKFVAFDIFLKVDEESPIYMTTSSNVVFKKTDPDSETEVDTGLKNAARVAFCVEGNAANGTAVGTITALKGATSHNNTNNSTGTVYFWEPNNDAHTSTGVANASNPYGLTTTAGTGNAALGYWGVKDEISTPVNLTDTIGATADEDLFEQVRIDYPTTVGQSTYTQVFTLQPGITKVRVYMWVEGQDVDCENTASGSNISFNVQFSLDSEAPVAP